MYSHFVQQLIQAMSLAILHIHDRGELKQRALGMNAITLGVKPFKIL